MTECYACQLMDGTIPIVGGVIHDTDLWRVEHCMGPLGLGALIVKPRRHVIHVWELTDDELAEMGPLIGRAAQVARELTQAEQVYVCLWSHAGFRPDHIHYVVQPVGADAKERHDMPGPGLQMDMFRAGERPDPADVERFVADARRVW